MFFLFVGVGVTEYIILGPSLIIVWIIRVEYQVSACFEDFGGVVVAVIVTKSTPSRLDLARIGDWQYDNDFEISAGADGVLAPRSAHAWPSTQSPIVTSVNLSAHMSGTTNLMSQSSWDNGKDYKGHFEEIMFVDIFVSSHISHNHFII